MTTSTDKIAGAPISWGVCEVPGWGYQLSPERVLNEMHQVGLAVTTTAGTSWSRTRSSPREPRGEGPVADVRDSAAYLRTLLTAGR